MPYPMLTAIILALTPSDATPQRLHLPADVPESFTLSVRHDDDLQRINLYRRTLRAPGAHARVYRADGTYAIVELPPPATYRGAIDGDPESAVVAHLSRAGVTATVFPPDGEPWTIRPTEAGRGAHIVGAPAASDVNACGVQAPAAVTPVAKSAPSTVAGGACQYLCEIAFDADFEYYQLKGASIPNVVAAIDAHMNTVDFFYARDVNISYQITDYIVRSAPFYTPTSGGDLLNQFRAEWNGNQAGVQRDIAHLMTDKPGSVIEFGGLAWVGAVCSSIGYGWSMDSTNIVGHELGHNWAAPHCLDLSPCNTMCGGCLNVGPVSRQVMIAHRDNRNCLDTIGPYADPLPPYASIDLATVRRHEFDQVGSLTFDVLQNDGDGNCDVLSIDTFDSLSERGATVVLSPGVGPGGVDELVYTLPAVPFIGDDELAYTVGDGTGEQTTGVVRVTSRTSALVGYWPLDGGPNGIDDAAGHGFVGTAVGEPIATAGVHGGALAFDGVDDAVSVPALNLNTDQVTITGWIRRSGDQADFAGVVFCRGGSTTAGLNVGTANELRYHWNDTPSSYSFNSGLIMPDETWIFVALVVEPDRATFYMNAGSGMQTAVNAVAHDPEAFDAATFFATDPGTTVRDFTGSIDDVRIYDYALDASEIQLLHDGNDRAAAPNPVDGGTRIDPDGDLTWLGAIGVVSHDVYFGTDYAAVRDATVGSPEYRGNANQPRYAPGVLDLGTTYFWRVDEVFSSAVSTGQVWQFTPARVRWWPLDETSGTTTNEVYGDDNGTLIAGAVPGQPAATAALGTSVFLDGVNDRIEVPALNLNSAEVTMAAWIRRTGPQADAAGLVFNRTGSTVAGLNLGADEDLRYHWDSANWWWASGLDVPDDQWTFIAMVIEPLQATLYMGVEGVLNSAVNSVAHAPEEFDGPTHFGQGIPGGRYFNGNIDDVRIYDVSLNASQIRQLFDSAPFCDPPADLNCDGTVNVDDLVTVILSWGPCVEGDWPCEGDINGDGMIDVDDLVSVIIGWSG